MLASNMGLLYFLIQRTLSVTDKHGVLYSLTDSMYVCVFVYVYVFVLFVDRCNDEGVHGEKLLSWRRCHDTVEFVV